MHARHLAFNLPLAKLYTNSLMSSLNSRAGWKFNTESARERSTAPGPKVRVPPPFPCPVLNTACVYVRPAERADAAVQPEHLDARDDAPRGTPPALVTFCAVCAGADGVRQVMVHVESHEMVDVEGGDGDGKWVESTSTVRAHAYKVREMV